MEHATRRWFSRSFGPRTWGGPPARAAARSRRPRRPRLEGLESRTVLSVVIAGTNNNGQGYAALDFNASGGYTPPDTNGAAGPSAYVETVNQTVALYGNKSTGAPASTAGLNTFWFSTGGLAHADGGSSLSDPIVVYNDQIGRFIVGDQDVNFSTHVSRFDFAVSKTSNPGSLSAADWSFYQVNTTESGYDADYPGNVGYNHDAFVFTLNMFGAANHALVVSVQNADLAANAPQSALHVYKNDLNDGSLRPTVMHDSVAGDPMWLVTEHGDNRSIDVIKETGVLSNSAAFAYTNLAVAAYSPAVNPLNPNGTVITNNMDSRIQKAAESKNVLVASHSVAVSSTEDDAQWYAVDVSSGTPVLKDQGRVSGGNNTYVTYPSVEINATGQVGMTYMKSGKDTSTDYLSMYVTGRNPGDPAGTMQAPVLVPAGSGKANYKDFSSGGRAGDLSGINVDPVDGSFWAANEFANTEATANWGTAVANFTIGNPLPSTDMAVTVAGPSAVDVSSGPVNVTYTVTVTNNGPSAAGGVVLTDTIPAGTTFVSITQTGGPDGFTTAQSGGKVTETATGSVASGSTDTFTVTVTFPTTLANGSTATDTASVAASNPDPNTANNTATSSATVTNSNPNADVSVAVSGPATANEGDTLTYTITVTNAGPSAAAGVTLTDTLASVLAYRSATTGQGTFSVSGNVVTFNIGTVGAGSTVTATVTAQAIEDGATSSTVSVSATSPDPNPGNNTATPTTTVAEPAIAVSGSIRTRNRTLTNFQTATFTHAGAVEPTSAFTATINWGDGTNSPGTITLSGTTYSVTGSHTYSSTVRHTISTSVSEVGASVDKFGDNPGSGGWNERDVVRLRDGSGDDSGDSARTGGGQAGSKSATAVNPPPVTAAARPTVTTVAPTPWTHANPYLPAGWRPAALTLPTVNWFLPGGRVPAWRSGMPVVGLGQAARWNLNLAWARWPWTPMG